jgi:hypothetical protein
VPQRLNGLISLCTNPVDPKPSFFKSSLKALNPSSAHAGFGRVCCGYQLN